jgi:hypothetical protein
MVRLDRLKRNDKTFTELVFYENDFLRSDNFLDLVTAILMNTTVEVVRFYDCANPKWSCKQFKLLFAAIARLPKLRLLSVARTNVPLSALSVVIQKGQQLRDLDVWGSKLIGTDMEVVQFSVAMRESNLSTMYLRKVIFSDAKNLDPLVSACQSTLESLTLEEVKWKPGAISHKVFEQLQFSSLSQLALRKLPLEDRHIKALGRGLKRSSLRDLTLSHIPISTNAAKALSEAISVNDNLKYLCLYKCGLSDEEGVEFGKVLQMNTSLTSLDLSENPIGDDGVIELANALLMPSSSIKVLEIQGNDQLQERGLQALLQLAEQSYVLEALKLYPLSRKSATKEQMDIQKKINACMNPVTRHGYFANQNTGKRPKVWYE